MRLLLNKFITPEVAVKTLLIAKIAQHIISSLSIRMNDTRKLGTPSDKGLKLFLAQ
jgi:hypothetical protein